MRWLIIIEIDLYFLAEGFLAFVESFLALWAVVVLLPSEEYSTDKNTGSNLIWNK
jgi:hypothetical protein